MTEERKIELLAELFEIDENEITPEKQLSDLNWDSMNMLGLIALFKSELNKELPVSKLRTFNSIKDILEEMK